MERHVLWSATVQMQLVKMQLHINIATIYHQTVFRQAQIAFHQIPFDEIIIDEKTTGNLNYKFIETELKSFFSLFKNQFPEIFFFTYNVQMNYTNHD